MPSRSLTITVILFWLGTCVWLFQREIWPRAEPGAVPLFKLYLTDDSQPSPLPVRWDAKQRVAKQNETRVFEYRLTTAVTHQDKAKEDTFVLSARLEPPRDPEKAKNFVLRRLESEYIVDERRRMIGLTASVVFRPTISPLAADEDTGEYEGTVERDTCSLSWEKTSGKRADRGKIEVDVSRTGLVLMPLHPVHLMEDLAPGRRWGCYLFDPVDQISAKSPSSSPRLIWVNAEVRKEEELLLFHTQERLCQVIDYEGDGGDVRGSTWVDVKDRRVLKMTIRLGPQDEWEIVRE